MSAASLFLRLPTTACRRHPCLLLLLCAACASHYRPEPLRTDEALRQLGAPIQLPEIPPQPAARELNFDRAVPQPEAADVSLSLEQTQALAILRHPSLRRMRAERGLADAADVRAETRPDPEISLTPLWIVPQAMLGGAASLRWELLPSGTRDARRGLAGALRASIDAEVAAREWKVAQDARVAWLELARAERAVELAERRLALARETRDFAQRMLDRGATTAVEASVIELENTESERDAAAARADLPVARSRLVEAAGLPLGTVVHPRADADPLAPLEPRTPDGDPDHALLARLPELRAAYSRYLVAERELEIAELGGKPRVSVGPDIQREADSTLIGGGVTFTLPISDANRAAIAEAKAHREIVGREFEERLFEARSELARARSEEDGAARTLAIQEQRVSPSAEAALKTAESAVQAGASDLLALQLARQRALEAQQAGLAARASHAIAVARLEAAFGPEPPPDSTEAAQPPARNP